MECSMVCWMKCSIVFSRISRCARSMNPDGILNRTIHNRMSDGMGDGVSDGMLDGMSDGMFDAMFDGISRRTDRRSLR